MSTASVQDGLLATGQRRISIQHRELAGVTPEMLAWWYGHVDGLMEYAGATYPRYLVWHPLDHISYEVRRRGPAGSVGPGTRLRITEAFQRDPSKLLRIEVVVARIDKGGAVVAKRIGGVQVVELVNRFEETPSGTSYSTVMTIGTAQWPRRLGVNRLLRARILPGQLGLDWARHHIEEIGNLEHFLPELYLRETGLET